MTYDPPFGRIGRARIVVLTITPDEFVGVRKALRATHMINGTPHFATTKARRVWDVVVSRCPDRSNIPTVGTVKDIIDDLRPQILVLVGTAGALCDEAKSDTGQPILVPREGLKLGDVVVAEYVDYIDFVKITDKGMFLRHYVYDHPSLSLRNSVIAGIEADYNLAKAITYRMPRSAADASKKAPAEPPKIICGPIVSGDKIMGGVDNQVQTGLLQPFDKSLAVEMEAVGMARAVCEQRKTFWYNPRYAVIRGISDIVGLEGNNATRAAWTKFAVHTATLVLAEFIKRLPMEREDRRTTKAKRPSRPTISRTPARKPVSKKRKRR
ncbi:5'-methylthioadenosine/S-adenosylhomocysteine nucleosidase family protein [Bradyrhizobium brasilense]|uniref:5'-methylthioadenosine/S-adenosylhomocysteine nucleosidase family protein n=1 Tax=Bradyrhizobium brasilense TaxID=1419277 RepID=UPI0011784AFF|nr:5'-methylthioadenosine/S-adenosylhomocysteine nucleosidase [Bradyrhizobium brasilense]